MSIGPAIAGAALFSAVSTLTGKAVDGIANALTATPPANNPKEQQASPLLRENTSAPGLEGLAPRAARRVPGDGI